MSITIKDVAQSVAAEVPYGSSIHDQVMHFLIREARLLDHRDLSAWGEMLAEDLTYFAPVRITQRVQNFSDEFGATGHYDDDYGSIMARIGRLVSTSSAWSEDPASRVRRFVSNVSVWETKKADEYEVSSYLLLTRNRADQREYKQLSAERNDLLRWSDGKFKLARREILVDQVVLGMPNFAIFL